MKMLSISIPDEDFINLGLTSDNLSFEEFVRHIKKDIAQKALRRAQRAAKLAGVADMLKSDIDSEIQASRRAKNHR
ncbi:MAG: hypothetical protein WCR52_01765 [Bacteroidota bacterium]